MTGFRAGIVGEGFGGALIIDDPVKPDDTDSLIKMRRINNRHNTTVASRLMHEDVPIIVIMQRLSSSGMDTELADAGDYSEFLLRGGSGEMWHHLMLPIDIDNSLEYPQHWTHGIPISHGLPDGMLWGYKHSELHNQRLKKANKYVYSAQYQQRPEHGVEQEIVKDADWHYYDRIPLGITRRIIYADTAQKVGDANDWTVFQCWGLVPNKGIFLLDQFREKVESPELRASAKAFWDKHRKPYASTPAVSIMKVEDKSSGTSLIQELKRIDRVNIVGIPRPAGSGKANRMIDFSPKIKDGFVFLPSGPTELTDASWVSDYLKEFRQFRLDMSHGHDDMVDPTLDAIDDLLLGSEKTNLAAGLYGRR